MLLFSTVIRVPFGIRNQGKDCGAEKQTNKTDSDGDVPNSVEWSESILEPRFWDSWDKPTFIGTLIISLYR